MEEKIANTIAQKQNLINELKKLKNKINKNLSDTVELTITSRYNVRFY